MQEHRQIVGLDAVDDLFESRLVDRLELLGSEEALGAGAIVIRKDHRVDACPGHAVDGLHVEIHGQLHQFFEKTGIVVKA